MVRFVSLLFVGTYRLICWDLWLRWNLLTVGLRVCFNSLVGFIVLNAILFLGFCFRGWVAVGVDFFLF